ncbi:DUF6493 family protein [Kibdelosporangium phytohabitans]|uniref:DUF7824 domain-containing protein n=1 Tax=Kibdelosporangium phytohabitans TaxID=860235 RepID=A0A0N9I433_9PSEU|nr:DUF6493 family protein [Kibdelosporangium phytohabitans]ALG10654.1 hypothetical protein AOZ06_30505 [Kibdelosporangium phytohabitans]MBE1461774.1 hypothetical protein [Kibdelosporangium phytohabitans]
MSDWAELEELLRKQDYDKLVVAVQGLDAAGRKALVDPVKAFEKRARDFQERLWHLRGGLSIVGAGVLPGASAVAPWLVRNGFWNSVDIHNRRSKIDIVDAVLQVLKARDVPWLPDLVQRLAARLSARRFDERLFRMVTELLAVTDTEPPLTDGMVHGLALRDYWSRGDDVDPRWLAVVPRMFEVVGVGRVFDSSGRYEQGWPVRLAGWAADGRVDRAAVIDGAIAALQRGGRQGDVRGYLRVYEALDLDLAEVVERVRDYVPLLADAHSSVAGVAQRELFRADDAGQLEIELLLDASRAVFFRPEKKLVRAQTARLGAVISREPGHADGVLGALAALFEHDAADLQAKALDMAIAHASAASHQARDELAVAASALPADLRAKAAKAFGAVDAQDAPVTTLLPAPDEPEFPAPIESLCDLVDELQAHRAGIYENVDMARVERLIAAVVVFADRDREGLRAAVEQYFAGSWYPHQGHRDWSSIDHWHQLSEQEEFASLISAAAAPCDAAVTTPYPPPDAVVGEKQWRHQLAENNLLAPQRVLVLRLHEISVGLAYAPRPMLVATPTHRNGLIDSEVLLERLTQAAAEGWEPWEHDLTQALLRLPNEHDAAVATRADALGTDAGKRLAHWLSNDGTISEAGTLGEILAAQPVLRDWYRVNEFHTAWSTLLPAHTEHIAMHMAPVLYEKTLRGRGGSPMLTALSRAAGKMGEHCARAFAHGLDAHDKNDRAEAVDALLVLAARDRWNPEALGEQVGRLAAEVELSLNRVVPCLRDLSQSGAASLVWHTIAAALPPMLSPDLERPPQRLADLLALAVELVEQVRPTAPIPELAAITNRRGTSRTVTEAKRLAAALPS